MGLLMPTKHIIFETEIEKKMLGILEAAKDGRFNKYLRDSGFDLQKPIYCTRDHNKLINELRQY